MTKLACTFFICCILFIACTNTEKNSDQTEKKADTPIVHTGAANPYATIDISPMDMSYFPVNYPQRKMTHDISTPPVMRVIYSRPHRQGRTIFGNLLKYGERWRLGANEASEIEFFQNVTIQNKKVNAGSYVIYCIPYQDKWTIVFNTNLYSWGLKQEASKDVYRFTSPALTSKTDIEYFTMVFENETTDKTAFLLITWDDVLVRLPINF